MSQSLENNRSAFLNVLRRSLSYEERASCPGKLQTWWKVCFAFSCVSFLTGVRETNVVLRHVVDGVYDEHSAEKHYACVFEAVLRCVGRVVDTKGETDIEPDGD